MGSFAAFTGKIVAKFSGASISKCGIILHRTESSARRE
jgi:hypothetical protein